MAPARRTDVARRAAAVTPNARKGLIAASLTALSVSMVLRVWASSMSFAAARTDWVLTVLASRDLRAGSWIGALPGGRTGSLEAALIALIGLPFAEATVLALWPVLSSAGIATLVWALARTRLASPWPLVAAALASVHPASSVVTASQPVAGFAAVLALGLGMLVLIERPTGEPPWWALGLLFGLGWWESDRIVLFLAPVAVALVVSGRLPSGRAALTTAAWASVGALPWLARTLIGRGDGGLPSPPEAWGDTLRAQWPDLWGRSVGIASPLDASRLISPAPALALVAMVVLASSLVLARRPRARFATLLLIPVIAVADLVSDLTALESAVLLAAPIALLAVVAVSALPDRHRPAAAVVLLIVTTLGTGLTVRSLSDISANRDDPAELAAILAQAGVTGAYSTDDTAVFLEFHQPEIISSAATIPDERRDQAVREARRVAHVFWIPGDPEAAASRRDRLNAIAGPVEEFTNGPYLAVVPIVNVAPEQLGP